MASPDLATLELKCPGCGVDLFEKRRGDWVLRNAIIKVIDGDVVARCPESGCRGEAPVKFLELVDPPAAPVRRRRLVVRASQFLDSEGSP